MGRPSNCGCCCTDEAITHIAETHRDTVSGTPHPDDNLLDAVEHLWQCFDGDISGLTQETVLQNCTVQTAEFVRKTTGGVETLTGNVGGQPQYENQNPGYVQGRLHGIVPTAGKAFAVCQILWTGQTFDAFSHKAHIAAGYPYLYGGEAKAHPLKDGAGHHGPAGLTAFEPRVYCGIAIRSGGLLFLFTYAPFGETAVSGPLPFGGDRDFCYDDIGGQTGFSARVLDGGILRQATLAELQANGLTVDPIAVQKSHEVGFFMAFAPTTDQYTGDLLESYSVTWNFDSLRIVAIYGLQCVAAFVDLDQLILSTPNPVGTANIEPNEFRGVNTTLTLDTLPASMGDDLADQFLLRHKTSGYAYIGQFNPSGLAGVTVDVWYLPCQLLTFKISDGTHCPLWFSIDHADSYSNDPDDGGGDDGAGNSTAPAFSGVASRDVWWPPNTVNNLRLGVQWYGSDCHDVGTAGHPTSGLKIDGVTGRCASGNGTSQCVQGNNPNQLTWMTNCYSLDPVAIGYRRRLTDNYGPGGVSCNLVDFTIPAGGEGDCTAMTDTQKRCHVHHLSAFGFSVSGGGTQLIEQILGITNAVHLYFDITEP